MSDIIAKPEVEILPPHDIRLSVSKTKTYETCAAQFKFSYILKLPKKDRDYLHFGTFLHEVLENFHRYYLNGGTEPYHIVISREYKDSYKKYSLHLSDDLRKEARQIIDNYLKIITKKTEPWTLNTVTSVEKKFSLAIKDRVLLNGFIDRIAMDTDGVLHVSDYKTSKTDRYLRKEPFQLLTYCYVLCLEDPTLQKVRASYIMLRQNFEWITMEFSREEIMKVEKKYLSFADQILSDKLYRAKPSPLCNYCDFLEHCPEGLERVKPNTGFGKTSW
jgi:putative RecB family exonuclease